MKLYVLAFVFALLSGTAVNADNGNSATVSASLTEAKYDRLMRIYVNKIKLAFVETDDAKTIEILSQYQAQFAQQTETLKTELYNSVKEMSKKDAAELFNRITAKSRNEEVIALLFDERITSRTSKNPEIDKLLESLRSKSLEIQNSNLMALGK